MKKILIILSIVLASQTAMSQKQLTYEQINSATEKPDNPDSYISKDGTTYHVGDTLRLGTPSAGGTWIYVEAYTFMGSKVPVPVNAANSRIIIKNLAIGGTKKTGFKAWIGTKAQDGVSNYHFSIEDAIQAGELIDPLAGTRMTSDQALEALKKEKDKLDLGLITQDQYAKRKEELVKFIK